MWARILQNWTLTKTRHHYVNENPFVERSLLYLNLLFYRIILITSTKNCAQNKVAILYFSYEGFLITVINWIKKEYPYFYIFQHGQTLHPCLLSVTCRFANKSRVLKVAFIFRSRQSTMFLNTKSPLAKTKTE